MPKSLIHLGARQNMETFGAHVLHWSPVPAMRVF
jgi:hypothetical protein